MTGPVADRPYTLLSCGVSIDGYLDSVEVKRLPLSNEADLDRVDSVRAGSDAILVGAVTVRNDNPRLLVRSPARQGARVACGLPPAPMKVTVTASGVLNPCSNFFTAGDVQKFVYAASPVATDLRERLGAGAQVIDAGSRPCLRRVSEDLRRRGVRRLMVEGGGSILTQFLTADLADELQLVVAPFSVGDSRARRFVSDGRFPYHPQRRATLAATRQIGDVVLLRYALSSRFCEQRAIASPDKAAKISALGKPIGSSVRVPRSTITP
jgi:5-amino-6-(5-phosphoribosylamino)uracil reductase